MERFKQFLNTTFLGGFLIVVPLVILFLLFRMLFFFIIDNIEPITQLFNQTGRIDRFLAAILTIGIILGISFLLGLFIRTGIGNFVFQFFEENILLRIPGYRIVKETVAQLFTSQKNLFAGVALVNLYGNHTLLTAFITDRHKDGSYTVFIPSAPAPTAGFVYHLQKEDVHEIDYPVDLAMKSIISLGAGSHNLYEKYLEKINREEK